MGKFLSSVFVLFILVLEVQTQTNINLLMEQERNEEFKKKREEWIKSLHRCEEGLPYWVIDQYTKESILSKHSHSKFDQTSSNEYAEGRIIGKWIEKGSDNLAGRVHTLDYDTTTNVIILASAGGNIWKGNISGNGWLCLNNGKKFANPRMVKILKNGTSQRIVVVANSPSSVYYTDDEGKIWQKAKGLENAERWGWTIRGVVTINQDIYVLLNEWNFNTWKSMISLYKSNDLGNNFVQLYSVYIDASLCDIWAPRFDQNILFLAVKDTLFTFDAQDNKNLVGINSFIDKYSSGIQLRGYTSNQNLILYLAYQTSSVQTVFYYSTNGGKSFTKTSQLNFYPFEKNSFEASQVNQNLIYFGQVEFYRSTDRGTSWVRANAWYEYYQNVSNKLHADIPGILSFRKWNDKKKQLDEILFVSTDGGLYVSFDQGITFTNLSLKTLNISQYYSVYTFDKKGKIVIAGSQDQGLQICLDDSGKALSFKQVISGDYGHLSSSNGGRFLWSVYPGFAMLVLNPQTGYFDAVSWNFVGSGYLWLPPIVADPDIPTKAYLLSGKNTPSPSTPGSYIFELNFDELTDSIKYNILPYDFAGNDNNRKVSALAISPLNTNYWFASTNDGKFFISTDRGTNWQVVENVAGPKGHYFYGNKILPSKFQLGKIVIAGSGYSNPGVLISIDTGKTFQPLSNNIPSTLFFDIEFNEDESLLFAATEIGPFVYHFGENKWYFLGGGDCPDNTFWDVEYLPELRTVRYATYGRGIWDFKIENVLTTPQLSESDDTPKLELALFPSPYQNSFNIKVKSSPGELLKIDIFDIEGRLVKRIWNDIAPNELMNLTWDGTSDHNIPLPTGKYFCIAMNKYATKYASLLISR